MKQRSMIHVLLLCALLLFSLGSAAAYAQPQEEKPRERQLENAMLQQLYPVIRSSLQEIYSEAYPSFGCERIISINERVTMAEDSQHASPVDAMHGATYFEITVGLCKGSGEKIELRLKNDTPTAQYYVDVFHVR
ncbi:hypothetical protein C7121_07170 [Paenibacillus glucanolyticus]|jgi:hypothetical protein|uniref:hypothetical protein n=1 Tax=Paenibacillus TaxID=44249 RepID=UPI0003E1C91B|nr:MULTISPECIES: hypothetical protein [Paenibacillus]ANA80044.1 hypothetical protein A3958_08650 [Paenibacillus glucanolyticus]AVV55930.1 hypothetical protein C7121_07170 [Paenibacillus glucanolyticus]ETT38433.1 hypothetical protein C169_12502 [Paenibacillus sp. FSL R5-808]OMF79273.1 hypothetical protein BK142_09025 [Paenibacillus glucanolyticus]